MGYRKKKLTWSDLKQ